LKIQLSRGPLKGHGCDDATVEDLKVQHGSYSPDVEEVLSSTEVACMSALSATEVSQTMFNCDSFAQTFAASRSGHQLAQPVLNQFIVRDSDSSFIAGGRRGALDT
jgi:hypothetical protein